MRFTTVSLKNSFTWSVLLFLGLFIPNSLLAYDFPGWYHGASGYNDAIKRAISEGKPLIVYFHAEWCIWSKKMNSDYLAHYKIEQFLNNIPKAEINPDKGSAEKALSKKYGVTGFPSFFVFIPALDRNPGGRIHPFKANKIWTISEFLHAIKIKLANQYNNKGYSCYKNKKYKEAIKYYKMAIGSDPENTYAYYGMGIVLHTRAYIEKNTKLLKEAETKYLKALEINPNHKGSKKELERLHKTMKKMGIR